jgi:transcription elongation GreA/GreB family factor
MPLLTKRDLIRQLQAELGREIVVLKQAALTAREAATHEESRPENDKDTRAVEAAYLAGAQADRARDLERAVNALEFLPLRPFGPADPIASGAVVEVDLEGERLHYFIAPQGGGLHASFEGKRIVVITPQSPIGLALLGKTVGDVVEVKTKNGLREYEIVRVS